MPSAFDDIMEGLDQAARHAAGEDLQGAEGVAKQSRTSASRISRTRMRPARSDRLRAASMQSSEDGAVARRTARISISPSSHGAATLANGFRYGWRLCENAEGLGLVMAMTRFRLYARTCRLISVATFLSRRIRRCSAPIQPLIVPKTCSTVRRLTRITVGSASSRRCMRSKTASCSQRVTCRSLAGVQRALIAQVPHAAVQ